MNHVAANAAADPQAEAREWLVRLQDDDLTEADIAAWEAWVRDDPANQAAYDKIAALWATVGDVPLIRPSPQQLAADSYDATVGVRTWNRRGSRLRLVWSASLVAAVGLFSVSAWTLWERTGVEPPHSLQTGLAQHQTATLSDGSQVQLAAVTAMDIKFVRRERLISMRGGEALFKVAHNSARPFIVQTQPARITAVGTAFDVHLVADEVVVDVTEGVVDVQPVDAGSSPVRVQAGRRLVTDGKSIRVSTLGGGVASDPAWLSGRLEYKNQPLAAVLGDLNRYARPTIVLGDPSAGQLSFTGTVQVDAIEEWAVALPRVFPLGVERQDGRIVLRSRKVTAPLSLGAQPRS